MLYSSLDGSSADEAEVVWRDVFLNTLCVFILFVGLILLLVNPPQSETIDELRSPGSVMVEIVWDNERNVDMDLWVRAPNDTPVGYSAKEGKVFNLLRDDLGLQNDVSGLNYENAISRGIAAGEYVVNLHHFNAHDGKGPINVQVVVSIKKDAQSSVRQILAREMKSVQVGKEVTVFRFKLDKDGVLEEGSVLTNIYTPLRNGAAGNSHLPGGGRDEPGQTNSVDDLPPYGAKDDDIFDPVLID